MAVRTRIDATSGPMLPQMLRYGAPLLLSLLVQELFKNTPMQALCLTQADLEAIEKIKQAVDEFIAKKGKRPGDWVFVRDYDENLLPGR